MNTHTPPADAIDDETRSYQERTASIRFKQNIIHGIGAATVFGLATAAFGALFAVAREGVKVAATNAVSNPVIFGSITATTLASIGIGLAVVVGIGCLYLSSKYVSELVRIEQDHHAKQIARGINGTTPTVERPVGHYPSQSKAPAATNAAEDMNPAQPTIDATSAELDHRVVALNTPPKSRTENFAARIAANDATPQTQVRA